MEKRELDLKAADTIRILSAAMVEKAQSGHPGGPMGGADFIHILYSEFLNIDPTDMNWFCRDRFFLDAGHMSAMLYAVLGLMKIISLEDLKKFRQWGSITPGHPELDTAHGIENTSGPLGQGHALALGSAIAEGFLTARFGEWMAHKTYAYISDGGIQEEISQGVGRLAGHLGLSNFIMFYDSNGIQLSHPTSDVTSEDTAAKYEAWGWYVQIIDGHDHEQIRLALTNACAQQERPSLIIGKTVMGKGAVTEEGKPFEGMTETHGMPLSKAGASFSRTIENLGGDPQNPFLIPAEVEGYYNEIRQRKIESAEYKKRIQMQWEKDFPNLADKLKNFLSNKVNITFENIAHKANCSTRAASGAVLAECAKTIENMIVASADLCNSDKTDGFLKHSKIIRKGDFSGNFLQVGVSEFTMASVASGMALHGGIIPVCGTFFVFSDYMKPALRLAALMGLPVKYVWSHDSFRVGEDGPTHQPIEQEAQIRLLEKIKNHKSKPSMLVLRPADAAETTIAWKMALQNTQCPTALILSRQDIIDIPPYYCSSRIKEAVGALHGAYCVRDVKGKKPDCILIANGSEVSTLIQAAEILERKSKIRFRIISVISEGLFWQQPLKYRTKLLPINVPIFGLSAGLPVTLQSMVGPLGKVYGLERFGASAPYTILDQKFGFTPQQVAKHIQRYMKDFTLRKDALLKTLRGKN